MYGQTYPQFSINNKLSNYKSLNFCEEYIPKNNYINPQNNNFSFDELSTNYSNYNNNLYNRNQNYLCNPCQCECHRLCNCLCQCQNELRESNNKICDLMQQLRNSEECYNKLCEDYSKIKNNNFNFNFSNKDEEEKCKRYLEMLQQNFDLLNKISDTFNEPNDKIKGDVNYYLDKPFEYKHLIDKYSKKIDLFNDLYKNNLNSQINQQPNHLVNDSYNPNNLINQQNLNKENINQNLNNPLLDNYNNNINPNLKINNINSNNNPLLYSSKSFGKPLPSGIKLNNITYPNNEEFEKLRKQNQIKNEIPQNIKDDIKNDLLDSKYKPQGPIQKSDFINNKYYIPNNNNNDNNTHLISQLPKNNNFENIENPNKTPKSLTLSNNTYPNEYIINENISNPNPQIKNLNNNNPIIKERKIEKEKDENFEDKNRFIKNQKLKRIKSYDIIPYFTDGNCWACNLGCSVSTTGYSPMNFSPYDNNIKRRDITPIKSGTIYEQYTRHKKNKKK